MPDQEPVKRPERRKPQLNCRPTQVVPSQAAEIAAEIIALQCLPGRRLLPFFLMPAAEFRERLSVVALRVG
jgi:hypothetical protein